MQVMRIFWPLFLSLFVTSLSARSVDSLLRDLGKGMESIHCEGTVNAMGEQNIQGVPFSAIIANRDSFNITMSGPFGITAAKLYATRDSFVFVNYLMQQVFDGRNDAPTVATAMPFGITITDLFALLKGQVPGDLSRFSVHSVRNDSTVLYVSKHDGQTEYVLIDTVRTTLRQYQSKDEHGVLKVNVTYADFHMVDDHPFSYAVDVAVDDKRQTMAFRMTSAHVNHPITEPLSIGIPSSFKRTSFR